MYTDKDFLKLSKRVGITDDVYQLLRDEKKRLAKEEKRKVSMAKIVCNLILTNLKK